jgi:hypothetical protein
MKPKSSVGKFVVIWNYCDLWVQNRIVPSDQHVTGVFPNQIPNPRDPKRFSVNQQPIRIQMMMIVPGSDAG